MRRGATTTRRTGGRGGCHGVEDEGDPPSLNPSKAPPRQLPPHSLRTQEEHHGDPNLATTTGAHSLTLPQHLRRHKPFPRRTPQVEDGHRGRAKQQRCEAEQGLTWLGGDPRSGGGRARGRGVDGGGARSHLGVASGGLALLG